MNRFKTLKKSKTAWAVLAFIIVFLFSLSAYKAEAGKFEGGYIELGTTVINSHSTTGSIGYRFSNNWDFSAGLIGHGPTKHGHQDVNEIFSLSHVVEPNWSILGADFYTRLGVAHIEDSPLVGQTNYRLGFGLSFGQVWDIELTHYSSAGTWPTNTGVDAILLRAKF